MAPVEPRPLSTCSPPQSLSVTLDHTAFPHILQAIITYAPRAALLQLRRTSHAMRDRADAALAHHLVVSQGNPLGVQARDGRLPTLRRWHQGIKGCETLFTGARVVDIVGMIGPYPRQPLLARLSAGGAVDTVRMRHPPGGRLALSCVVRARHLIVFTTITERDSGPTHPDGSRGIAIADTVPIPQGTLRAVLNVRYDPNRPWLAQAYIHEFFPPKECTELVIIFTEKATHREPQVGGGVWPAQRESGILYSIVFALARARHRAHLHVVLVDAHKLRPEWLGMRADATADEMESGILGHIDRIAPDESEVVRRRRTLTGDIAMSDQDILEGRFPPTSTISFMSRYEYRAVAGGARFDLETVE